LATEEKNEQKKCRDWTHLGSPPFNVYHRKIVKKLKYNQDPPEDGITRATIENPGARSASETMLIQPQTLLDFPQLRGGYIDTPLGRKLVEKGLTASMVAQSAGVSRADVSHYLHGRRGRVGKERRKNIYRYLQEAGIEKPRKKNPSVCRGCGMEYPTRGGTEAYKKAY